MDNTVKHYPKELLDDIEEGPEEHLN